MQFLLSWMLVTALAAPLQTDSESASAPDTNETASTRPSEISSTDDLLEAVETRGQALEDFVAEIIYFKKDAMFEATERRYGEVLYQRDEEQEQERADASAKRLAIIFDRFIDADGVGHEKTRHYIFDDGWLVDIDAARKQVIKRRIARPGEQFDPFKLGEGLFPLPLGQPKDEVLARFEVEWIDSPPEKLITTLPKAYGVSLRPKAKTSAAEEFSRIDIFYDKESLLPIGINAVEVNGDRKIVRLKPQKYNKGLDESEREQLEVKEFDPTKWRIHVE